MIKSIGTVKRGILLAFTVEMRDGPTGALWWRVPIN